MGIILISYIDGWPGHPVGPMGGLETAHLYCRWKDLMLRSTCVAASNRKFAEPWVAIVLPNVHVPSKLGVWGCILPSWPSLVITQLGWRKLMDADGAKIDAEQRMSDPNFFAHKVLMNDD